MQRRQRQIWLQRAVLLAALLLPLVLSLWGSYWLTRHSLLLDLQQLTGASARRTAIIIDQGRASLQALRGALHGDCARADLLALRQAGFSSLYYREAGLVQGGQLLCTSFEQFAPPMTIPGDYLRRAALYRDGEFEIREPQPTVVGGRSLIVVLHTDRAAGNYLNLLLNLDQLAELVAYFERLQGGVFLLGADDRPPLQVAGPALSGIDPRQAGVQPTADGGLAVIAHAAPYPIATAVRVSQTALITRWRAQAQPAAILGVLVTSLILFALRRWLPGRNNPLDELRRALQGDQFELHFQPVVDARDGQLLSAEALIRWRHPRRGLLYPDSFLPLVERAELLDPLTEWVLRRSAAALNQLPGRFRIAVNVPPRLLRRGRLENLVDTAFGEQARLDRLTLEITERELIEYTDLEAQNSVRLLASRGAKISLDDFGTGFSGLSQLRFLHPQQIKIDRSFIRALGSEAVTAALVDAVVAMTDTLGVELVAEGVETEAQRSLLLQRGIHAHQGWLYARAMPLNELLRFIETKTAPTQTRAQSESSLS